MSVSFAGSLQLNASKELFMRQLFGWILIQLGRAAFSLTQPGGIHALLPIFRNAGVELIRQRHALRNGQLKKGLADGSD